MSSSRIALGVEYDGSAFFGWQRQREVVTVQAVLEQALSNIAAAPIELTCAGRTDAGVHATGQVVHFDTPVPRQLAAWTMGVNSQLPAGVAVRWAQPVDPEFHARFSATARRYRYIIANTPLRPAVLAQGVSHYPMPLAVEAMHEAAQVLLGEHDFSAFRAAQCQSKSCHRNVHHVRVSRHGDYVVVDIQANAFLHHMVRNIVGSLLEIGQGLQPIDWLGELLAAADRSRAAATAKPHGLYLVAVQYPAQWQLPAAPLGPLWLGC